MNDPRKGRPFLAIVEPDGTVHRLEKPRRSKHFGMAVSADELELIHWAARWTGCKPSALVRAVVTCWAASFSYEYEEADDAGNPENPFPREAAKRVTLLGKALLNPNMPPPGGHSTWTARRRKQK